MTDDLEGWPVPDIPQSAVPQLPLRGDETMLDGVRSLYPDLKLIDAVRTAESVEAWISNGMMNRKHPARASVDGNRLEIEVLGVGRINVDLPSAEGLNQ